jgi:hypothetical protein
VREEFGGGAGLSMLSIRLVPWRIQVLFELAFETSLVITSDSSKHLVYIVYQDYDSFECFILFLGGVKY